MKADLYLPYLDYNDGAFDTNDTYFSSEEEYANAVKSEFNKNKDVVFNSMSDYKSGGSLIGADGQTYKIGRGQQGKEDKVSNAKCESNLFDDDGNDDTVDALISKFVKQEPFVEMLELDLDTSEEEFETELSLWFREHSKILSYKEKLGEEWAWVNEPKRNVKAHFKNNANEDVYAIFENCKIMDKVDARTYIVFIERMNLIDKI